MQVWKSAAEWKQRRTSLPGSGIGFVPTMGALHRGHASLVERCRAECNVATASIFVNPSQFDDPKDLARYPHTLDNDLALLERLGVDDVLVPTASEMYPHGYRMRVQPDERYRTMEGLHRPGFLEGVATVVLKLLNLVRPQRAYFGEKDYQQLMLITDLAAEFFLDCEIVPCATVRTTAGLAESSRNALLSERVREIAPLLFSSLAGSDTAAQARTALEAHGFKVDYVEDHANRRFAAAFLDGVRLIDNVPLCS
jgi:pantoate--beta-alanine ligase